jgi:REP element-mobilizing transposase RayT
MQKDPIPFQAFNERGDFRSYYHGVLPHWRQTGCTYFVTFRMADSIPSIVLEEIEDKRMRWLKSRGINPDDLNWERKLSKLPISEQRMYDEHVVQMLNTSLDECHGSCALKEEAVGNKVAVALNFFHGERVLTGDFAVMPNHVHVLLTPINGFELEDILHSIKSYTANEINKLLERNESFWQRESYDHIVRDTEQLQAYQRYIAANPLKAKLREGEYVLASAVYEEVTA